MYTEGERAHLTCSVEYKETMDIISNNYINGTCSHSETYGIRNICNGKTNCSFDVSNSNIGSSCGANGKANLEVKYNCIRKGKYLLFEYHFSAIFANIKVAKFEPIQGINTLSMSIPVRLWVYL